MTRIAVAKGRILKDFVGLLDRCGMDSGSLRADSRSLVRSIAPDLEAIIVRSQDVPLYVERGACTLGVTGLDTLAEKEPAVFELLDLGIGGCRLCLAGPPALNLSADPTRFWRIATKYPRVTAAALERLGLNYEIIALGGTLETAPESGIADAIVDLVDTGKTLAAHDLVIHAELLAVTSRLIAQPSGFYRERAAIAGLLRQLSRVVSGGTA